MEDTKIQWHPGFVAAMDMEFKEDREKLESRPRELFNYFKKHNVEVEMPYRGIYYIKGISPFPAQVIVIKELGKEGHMWIKALTEKMEKADLEKLIEKSGEFNGEYDRKLVESILEVALNANLDLVEELRGDAKMGEIMLKIMQPAILEIEKSAEIRGKKAGIEEGRRTGMEEGKIIGAIEILRNFKSNDDVKKIIMEKYKLTENDVEKYL